MIPESPPGPAGADAPTPAGRPEGAGAAPVRPCVLISVYNHAATLMAVVRAAGAHVPVIVVDDGSMDGAKALLEAEPGITAVFLPCNRGKGAALRAGFDRAAELGFTHAITMDADGQHDAGDIPAFVEACRREPGAFLVGVRDLKGAGAPLVRRMTNAFSNFWYRVETGLALPDTQAGFRCYPLAMARGLAIRSGRYAYELEVLVRAAWTDMPVRTVPIRVDYGRPQSQRSHFRPVVDFLRISRLNNRLVLQAFFLPRPVRALLSRRELEGLPFFRRMGRMALLFFTEHADTPGRLAGAVGLGLFCGIAPIWGFQMLTAAVLAHALRLNKAVALAASNVSLPLLLPFILFGSLFLGHWVWTGEPLRLSWEEVRGLSREQLLQGLGEYVVGSLILAALVAAVGMAVTLVLASRRRGARAVPPPPRHD